MPARKEAHDSCISRRSGLDPGQLPAAIRALRDGAGIWIEPTKKGAPFRGRPVRFRVCRRSVFHEIAAGIVAAAAGQRRRLLLIFFRPFDRRQRL